MAPDPMATYLLSQKRYTIYHTIPIPFHHSIANRRNTNHPILLGNHTWIGAAHFFFFFFLVEESSQGLSACFQRIISFYFMLSPEEVTTKKRGKINFICFSPPVAIE